mgnify:CR=1 FL=1
MRATCARRGAPCAAPGCGSVALAGISVGTIMTPGVSASTGGEQRGAGHQGLARADVALGRRFMLRSCIRSPANLGESTLLLRPSARNGSPSRKRRSSSNAEATR